MEFMVDGVGALRCPERRIIVVRMIYCWSSCPSGLQFCVIADIKALFGISKPQSIMAPDWNWASDYSDDVKLKTVLNGNALFCLWVDDRL
jgi:hypothetical protein